MSNDDCEIIYSQSNLESIRADYEKQLSFIKKQLDEAKTYCSKKDQTISELQLKLDRLSLELDDKKDEFSLINKKTKDIQDIQSQAREKAEKAEKDLHKAYVELTQVQDRNLSLTTENKKLIELVAAQKKDIEKSNEIIKKLTTENAALRTELAKKVHF